MVILDMFTKRVNTSKMRSDLDENYAIRFYTSENPITETSSRYLRKREFFFEKDSHGCIFILFFHPEVIVSNHWS